MIHQEVYLPPENKRKSPERDHLIKEVSFSNHQISGDILVSGGYDEDEICSYDEADVHMFIRAGVSQNA